MRDVTLLSMKNKSVQNRRFVHHAKYPYNMTMLNKFFKIEFEKFFGGGGLEKSHFFLSNSLCVDFAKQNAVSNTIESFTEFSEIGTNIITVFCTVAHYLKI